MSCRQIDLCQLVHPECTYVVDFACHASSKTVYLVDRSGALFNLKEDQSKFPVKEPLG